MANSEKELLHKVEMLEDLAEKQNKALEMANHLLDLKDQLIRMCEEETELYKKENKRLRETLIVCGAGLILTAIFSIIRLLA